MIRTPSRFLGLPFLDYLRKNKYIAKSGIEYSKEETDELFSEKTAAAIENKKDPKSKWDDNFKQSKYKAECFL